MTKNISFLGIDIGGAHIKIVGLDKYKNVSLVEYRKCYLWQDPEKLKKEIQFINSLSEKNKILCGITMTAELCDIFSNRIEGAKKIQKECKKIKFKKFFYSKSDNLFENINENKFTNFISMNWHAIGRYMSKHIREGIIIDFGSTTTDFVLIKGGQVINNSFSDYTRLGTGELVYTGIIRSPIFAIMNSININTQKYKIIPEYFSSMSDIYRIHKKIKKNFDVDDETDSSDKSIISSYHRISRSFGFDFNKKYKKLIYRLTEEIMNKQLKIIYENAIKLFQKYNLNKNSPIILSGIGQNILMKSFKSYNVILFENFIKSKTNALRKSATYHAPAVSIACLLDDMIE